MKWVDVPICWKVIKFLKKYAAASQKVLKRTVPWCLGLLSLHRLCVGSYRVKSGNFRHEVISDSDLVCFIFHISFIGIKNKLTKQTVKILMRRLIRSRLIWISTVCKIMSEFTWCLKLPDFILILSRFCGYLTLPYFVCGLTLFCHGFVIYT